METKKLKVAVLAGGPSGEREVSLRSGENVTKQLSKEKYSVTPIDILDATHWQIFSTEGELQVVDPAKEEGKEVLREFDLFFNALHGPYGEDGQLQKALEAIGKPYTGSTVEASEKAMDKVGAMKLLQKAEVFVPEFFEIDAAIPVEEVAEKITKSFGYPAIVKPNATGSTLGLSLVAKEEELATALKSAFEHSERVIIQRYIFGREFTCGVMGNAGGELSALLPIEIVIKNKVFDFNDKYFSKDTQELCPAPVDKYLMKKIQDEAVLAHKVIGCDGLSRTDFRMDGRGDLYFLETNTSPGLTETSLCPKEAIAQGLTIPQFLDQIIDLALVKK